MKRAWTSFLAIIRDGLFDENSVIQLSVKPLPLSWDHKKRSSSTYRLIVPRMFPTGKLLKISLLLLPLTATAVYSLEQICTTNNNDPTMTKFRSVKKVLPRSKSDKE